MKVLILGATGAVGVAFIREGLVANHQLVIYARSPNKLPEDITNNPNVVVRQGELSDESALRDALVGVHAVISALGPAVGKGPLHPSGTPLAKAYVLLLRLMHDASITRLIALGTASNKDDLDKFSATFWVFVNGVATFAHNAYKDVVEIGNAIRSDPNLLWTLARVPVLTNKDDLQHYAGYIGDGHTSPTLTRKAYAAFVVGELSNNHWIKKSPLISCG